MPEVSTMVLSNGTMNQVWKGVCEHLLGRTELQGASTIWIKQTEIFVCTLSWWLRVSAETWRNNLYFFILIRTSAISWNKSYLKRTQSKNWRGNSEGVEQFIDLFISASTSQTWQLWANFATTYFHLAIPSLVTR